MINPLISVIVPIYNVEAYLKRCVDSILKQTYTNIEVILVDDGSGDHCGEICDEYAAIDNRIKVIHRNNGGLSAARNSGLDIAKGEYIICVDSDDWIISTHIEWLWRGLCESESLLCICQFQKINSEADVKKQNYVNPILMGKEDVMFIALTEFKWWSVCDKLFHKSLFDGIRFPECRNNEDYAIIFKIINKCDKISVLNVATYCYYTRQGSITQSKLNSHSFDAVINSIEVLSYMEENYSRLVQPAEAILIQCCLKLLSDIYINDSKNYEAWRIKMIDIVRSYRKRWIINPYIYTMQKMLLLPICVSWKFFELTLGAYRLIVK